jgi:hypothetical protein
MTLTVVHSRHVYQKRMIKRRTADQRDLEERQDRQILATQYRQAGCAQSTAVRGSPDPAPRALLLRSACGFLDLMNECSVPLPYRMGHRMCSEGSLWFQEKRTSDQPRRASHRVTGQRQGSDSDGFMAGVGTSADGTGSKTRAQLGSWLSAWGPSLAVGASRKQHRPPTWWFRHSHHPVIDQGAFLR